MVWRRAERTKGDDVQLQFIAYKWTMTIAGLFAVSICLHSLCCSIPRAFFVGFNPASAHVHHISMFRKPIEQF